MTLSNWEICLVVAIILAPLVYEEVRHRMWMRRARARVSKKLEVYK